LTLRLLNPDYTTAVQIAEAINQQGGGQNPLALARDAHVVMVQVPQEFLGREAAFIAQLEQLMVQPTARSKIVVNERTGTVVIGSGVRILPVVISHGAIRVEISTEYRVSQPAPFGRGATVVVPQTTVTAEEARMQTAAEQEVTGVPFAPGPTIQDLVDALNFLRITPRDLIAILQALQRAGALMAELEIM
jgi:flagellar P-ring protein precursor FlgI